MFIPKPFEVTDENELFAFIKAHGFGQIISKAQGQLCSSHIPFMLSNDHTQLLGHLAKKNHQLDGLDGQEVLITFQGAHDYISPSWYASAGVPTWNYQAVHINGRCRLIHNPSEIKSIISDLTHQYEAKFKQPWQVEYKESMLGAIVGVEVEISKLQGKFKLSQNRSEQDQQQVIDALEAAGSHALAQAMRVNKQQG